ncbi:MAG: GNAT family N-acetyltransferase [Bacteroidota bacterium]
MILEIELAPKSQRPVLRQLMELYCYDFSEYDDLELNEHGYYAYSYLDYYWTEEDRHPYLIKVDGNLAGFVLVNQHFVKLRPPGHTIAEFFIMRKYRKQGLVKRVAFEIFDKYGGSWEVAQQLSNKPSLVFWEKVIKDYVEDWSRVKVYEVEKKQIMVFEEKGN